MAKYEHTGQRGTSKTFPQSTPNL